MGWSIERFMDKESLIEELICPICKEVLENPMQMQCQHLFCNACINTWFHDGNLTCPVDRLVVEPATIKPARLVQHLLSNLTVRCKYFNTGCALMASFKHMEQLIFHENRHCSATQNGSFCNEYDRLVENAADQMKRITMACSAS